MKRIESIIKDLYDIPISVFVAIDNDFHQIPQTKLWESFLLFNNQQNNHILHVGDYAGRIGDSSCVDREFALNLKVKFQTSSEYFLEERPEPYKIKFYPLPFLKEKENQNLRIQDIFTKSKNQEFIVIVGPPSSGKTYVFLSEIIDILIFTILFRNLAKILEKEYDFTYFSFDSGDDSKIIDALEGGSTVIIDGHFPSTLRRQQVNSLAKQKSILCSCILLDVSFDVAKHLNALKNVRFIIFLFILHFFCIHILF